MHIALVGILSTMLKLIFVDQIYKGPNYLSERILDHRFLAQNASSSI